MSDFNGDGDVSQRILDALRNAGLEGVTLRELEAAVILNAMEAAGGDRTKAAKILGISAENLDRKLDGPA